MSIKCFMLLMSIKCFDLQDPNPIGVLTRKGVYHGGIESCDNWGWVPEPPVVICSTLSLRAINKELTPLIILLTKTLSSVESPVDELRLARVLG